jgi:hypothetical protein
MTDARRNRRAAAAIETIGSGNPGGSRYVGSNSPRFDRGRFFSPDQCRRR